MKALTIAFIACTAFAHHASAGIITYDIDFVGPTMTEDGTDIVSDELVVGDGSMIFDSDADTALGLYLTTGIHTVSWSGIEPVHYHVSDFCDNCYRSGGPGTGTGLWAGGMGFDFDIWWAPEGAKPLEYMEGAVETFMVDGPREFGQGAWISFTKVSTVEVPEPSTLALLGLGLLAFAVKRHPLRVSIG